MSKKTKTTKRESQKAQRPMQNARLRRFKGSHLVSLHFSCDCGWETPAQVPLKMIDPDLISVDGDQLHAYSGVPCPRCLGRVIRRR